MPQATSGTDATQEGQPGNPDRWLTDSEAADLLGLSQSYLRKLRCTGGGPTYSRLAAKAIRYRTRDLTVWASARAERCTSDREVQHAA
jgi:hypothetical protein